METIGKNRENIGKQLGNYMEIIGEKNPKKM